MKAIITTTATLDVGVGGLILLLALIVVPALALAAWRSLRAPGWVRARLPAVGQAVAFASLRSTPMR